jgi:glycine betaine/proline transport system permease protein
MDRGANPLEDTESEAALAYAEERRQNIRTFVRTNPDYYIANFDKIGASSKFTATFNFFAGLFGPVWFGARGLWSWALPFLILEALALVQIARGLFGDLGAEAMARIHRGHAGLAATATGRSHRKQFRPHRRLSACGRIA